MARRLLEDAFGYNPIPFYGGAQGLDTLIHATPGLPSYVGAGGGGAPRSPSPSVGIGNQAGGLTFVPPITDPNLILSNASARAAWQGHLADLLAQQKVIPGQLHLGLARLGEAQHQQSGDLAANMAARGLYGGVPATGQQRVATQFNQQRQDLSLSAEQQLSDIARAIASGRMDLASQLAGNALQYGQGQGSVLAGGFGGLWGPQGFGSAGAPYAQALWNTAKGLFPGLSFDGIFSPRNIRGTNTLSTHALGNAVDIGVPNQQTGMALYNWLRQNQQQWGIHTILYDPAGAHGVNVGDHINHIHVDWGYSPWAGWSGFNGQVPMAPTGYHGGGGPYPSYGGGGSTPHRPQPRRRAPTPAPTGGGGAPRVQ